MVALRRFNDGGISVDLAASAKELVIEVGVDRV